MARSRSSERGFSLIEVMVATGLLAVAALGVAQLFAFAAQANLSARGQTSTAALAVQKMEQLRSLSWGYTDPGGLGIGTLITDTTTNLSVDPPAGGGTGLTASPTGALDENTPPFVDYLDANGSWVGNGATPAVGTVYIRRWSIEPLPTNPNNTLVLQVVVTTLRGETRRVAGTQGRLKDDTRLVSVKTRKAL